MSDAIVLTREQLDLILEKAAEKGAREVLKQVGLGDENAGADITSLRTLLDSWRSAKRTFWESIIKWAVTALLATLMAGLYIHFGRVPGT